MARGSGGASLHLVIHSMSVALVQTGMPMCALSALGGPFRLSTQKRQVLLQHYAPWALRAGTRAADLMCLRYEIYFEEVSSCFQGLFVSTSSTVSKTSRGSDLCNIVCVLGDSGHNGFAILMRDRKKPEAFIKEGHTQRLLQLGEHMIPVSFPWHMQDLEQLRRRWKILPAPRPPTSQKS
jgi:hypothetical protein